MLPPVEHQEFLECFWLVHVMTGSAERLPFAASTVSRVTKKSTAAKAHCQYSRRCVSVFWGPLDDHRGSGRGAHRQAEFFELIHPNRLGAALRRREVYRKLSDQPFPFAV
ncbi:MAG: hypothetical protein CM1200mP34_2620 [Verrucomicrobiales bacterium]|nr:MAG: hypothetical protein CM1200mP34_2620 [Verrucomicrobiales bacterium]